MKLTEKEVSREEAYRIVQSLAHSIWNKSNVAFKQVVLESEEIHSYISKDEIDTCFDLQNNLRHVNTIFERIGLN